MEKINRSCGLIDVVDAVVPSDVTTSKDADLQLLLLLHYLNIATKHQLCRDYFLF